MAGPMRAGQEAPAQPGFSEVDRQAMLTRIAELEASTKTMPIFVDAAIMTIEELLATYPAAAPRRGKYARVSNYAGYVDRVLRCDYDDNLQLYFWAPTLAEYGRSIPMTVDLTLKRLLSPTSVVLTGTIPVGATRNLTIETINGRPGEIVEIRAGFTTLAGTLNVLGTGVGSGVTMALGGYQKYLIDGASGSLKLVRLV